MQEEYLRAIFLLADVPITGLWRLANQYDAGLTQIKPWWLVSTSIGMIVVGWRKRVISIDWAASRVRRIITSHETTKEETYVHAWSYAHAVEYVKELHQPDPT